VTISAGVPTVWANLLAHVEAHGLRFSRSALRITAPASEFCCRRGALCWCFSLACKRAKALKCHRACKSRPTPRLGAQGPPINSHRLNLPKRLRTIVIGGAAAPRTQVAAFEE
jgi:hypothetical protein